MQGVQVLNSDPYAHLGPISGGSGDRRASAGAGGYPPQQSSSRPTDYMQQQYPPAQVPQYPHGYVPPGYPQPVPGYPVPYGYPYPPPGGYIYAPGHPPYGHPPPHPYPPPHGYGYPPPAMPGMLPLVPMQASKRPRSNTSDSEDESDDDEDHPVGQRNKKKRRKVSSSGQTPDNLNMTNETVMSKILEAARCSEGSRLLQVRLSECEEDRQRIHDAIIPDIRKLSTELHASSVVQRLIEVSDPESRLTLASKLRNEIFEFSRHKFACRVVQKVFETLRIEEQPPFISELKGNVFACVENMHANHVIQGIIKHSSMANASFILNDVSKDTVRMCKHMYGCRILQRLLERFELDSLSKLLDAIVENAPILTSDKHGNYVIQCALDRGRKGDKSSIMEMVCYDLVKFATDKVASNVVEKCFEISTVGPDAEDLKKIREALYRRVFGDGSEDAPLQKLFHDRYGNYTLQCIIKHSRGSDTVELEKQIMDCETSLKQTATGRNIIAAIQKATGKLAEHEGPELLRPAPEAPSKGSVLHPHNCKPCAWFWKAQGCRNDQECQHCHLCPDGELKERKKATKARRISMLEDIH